MSFINKSLALAFIALTGTASIAFAQVGGGTELPNSAEPNSIKPGGGAMKGGMMKKHSSMKKVHKKSRHM